MELSDEVHARITKSCELGNSYAAGENFPAALHHFWKAYDQLPEPKNEWSAGTWILAAVGDVNFQAGDFEAGRDNLSLGMHYPNAIGNPFMHLRLGQCQFELGNMERAADELMRAYMGAGPKIFASEDEKYLRFLATRAEGIRMPLRYWLRKMKLWPF